MQSVLSSIHPVKSHLSVGNGEQEEDGGRVSDSDSKNSFPFKRLEPVYIVSKSRDGK